MLKALKKTLPEVDIATVHKYQGREMDNIIISITDNEITKFADNSNMFNVAISRAKKKLAIVLSGNKAPEIILLKIKTKNLIEKIYLFLNSESEEKLPTKK